MLVTSRRAAFTILAVDDNLTQLYATARWLMNAGFAVVQTEYGEKAPSLAAEADGIVLDVNLPDKHGFEVARELHERYPAKPLVFISAMPITEAYRAAAELVGAKAYLTTPIDPEILIPTLDDLLGV